VTPVVQDNPAQQRFEIQSNGATAFIAYHREGDGLSLDHTEVPSSLAGKGIGSALVKGALDQLRDRGVKVLAHCAFVAAYIDKHPEYRSLLQS